MLRFRFLQKLIFLTVVISSSGNLMLRNAWAAPTPRMIKRSVYIEAGTGLSQIRKADGFFGTQFSSSLKYSSFFNFVFTISLTDPVKAGHLELGMENRVNNSSQSGTYYGILAPYFILRFVSQNRLIMGLGMAPVMFKRQASQLGFTGYNRAQGSTGFLAELGYIMRLSPKFQLVLNLGGEVGILGGGKVSPKPALGSALDVRFTLN